MKTSIAGLITAAAGFVMFSPDLFVHYAWAVPLAKYITVGGLASIGVLSKDFNSHSTSDQVMKATTKPPAAPAEQNNQ